MALTEEELKKLRERRLSAEGIEPTPLTKSEQNLHALINERREFFSQYRNNSDTENKKKGLLEEFLLQSQPFRDVKGFLENIAISAKLPALAESLALSFDRIIEKYNPSSPEETAHINKIKNGGIDQREIKLNGGENLIEQFAKEGVDLQFINEKVRTLAIMNPFSKYHQFIPIKLEDNSGRTLNLDIKQYAKDAFEHYQLKHNDQQNTQPGSTNSHPENQQHNLPGFLALYAKEKFLEKYPQESSDFLSKNDKEEIAGWKKRGEFRDQRTEEFLIKIGFKKPPLQESNKRTREQHPDEGQQNSKRLRPEEDKENTNPQKQPVAEGPQAREGILKRSPTPNSSPERPPENQEKRSEEKTPTDTPNYLPTPLPKKGVKFAGDVKKEDGKKGEWGQWVKDTKASSHVPNQHGSR